jgi:hypothetical protein
MIRACKRCRFGIPAVEALETNEGVTRVEYVVCALMPPTPGRVPDRPAMRQFGWCGQFRLSLLRLFGYGARA